MDLHPTPFPGSKPQSVRSKYKKVTETSKPKPKEAPIQRQNRIFGTARNPNVPSKTVTVTEKPITKPSQKPNKPPEPGAVSVTEPPVKKSPVNDSRSRPKKKTVSFSGKIGESLTKAKNSEERGIDEGLKTPVRLPGSATPKISGTPRNSVTPYRSAEKCRNCRFDRLETTSYWLGQIRLAESVGKHFVSATFFRLASDSKAEPIQNLRVELKRYLSRHEDLSTELEWQEVCQVYSINLNYDDKQDMNLLINHSGCEKLSTNQVIVGDNIGEEEPKIEDKEELKEMGKQEAHSQMNQQ